ncbi:hypothetical protein GXM_07785 [Nostoc sphaeroides CCNUC1]|uniref:Uncharacterized protein n=1 Tax=Nostoc sphaeroides CCNUC1 TaxID=2653204 RepID=A0A5P8WCJ1_9NOSO|nr:hypothetical protein GXM_07785 [Nostoc sphaeroides CCNUC1]
MSDRTSRSAFAFLVKIETAIALRTLQDQAIALQDQLSR